MSRSTLCRTGTGHRVANRASMMKVSICPGGRRQSTWWNGPGPKEAGPGESRDNPTPGAQVQTWALIPTHTCQCPVTPTMPTIPDCPEENQIRRGTSSQAQIATGPAGTVQEWRGPDGNWEGVRSLHSRQQLLSSTLLWLDENVAQTWQSVFKRNPNFHVKSLSF